MKPIEQLRQQFQRLDGQDYGAYQSLRGPWRFPEFELHMDCIPKDPYAPPGTGVFRARVRREAAGFPPATTASPIREIALRDYLARRFHANAARICRGRRGTGNSGIIAIAEPGCMSLCLHDCLFFKGLTREHILTIVYNIHRG